MVRKIKKRSKDQEPAAVEKPTQRREREAVEKWEEARKMGKFRYVLMKGTLAWSLMTSCIFILLTLISNKFSVNNEMLWYFLKMAIVFVGMGTLFGVFSWQLSEKKYQKYMNENTRQKSER